MLHVSYEFVKPLASLFYGLFIFEHDYAYVHNIHMYTISTIESEKIKFNF